MLRINVTWMALLGLLMTLGCGGDDSRASGNGGGGDSGASASGCEASGDEKCDGDTVMQCSGPDGGSLGWEVKKDCLETSRKCVQVTDIDADCQDPASGDDAGMQGDCPPFPLSFGEQAGAFYDDAQAGRIVQYNAFQGLAENHLGAEAIFSVTLWASYGATLAPGTVDLTGIETSLKTCANCIEFHQGAVLDNTGARVGADHSFMPESGTLLIEELSPQVGGSFKFTLDAEMIEVTYGADNLTTTPKPDGCRFSIQGFARTAVLE